MPTNSHPLAETGALKYNSVTGTTTETASVTCAATKNVYHALYWATGHLDTAAKVGTVTVSVAGTVVFKGLSATVSGSGHYNFDKPIVAGPNEVLLVQFSDDITAGAGITLSTGILTSVTPTEASA